MKVREYLDVAALEKWDRKDTGHIMAKLFKNCKLLFSTTYVDDYSGLKHSGSLFELPSGKIILCNDCYEGVYISKKISDMDSNQIIDFYINVCDNSIIFSDILDTVEYLRQIKQDHAVNFDLKSLVDSFIYKIYEHRLIEFNQVVLD